MSTQKGQILTKKIELPSFMTAGEKLLVIQNRTQKTLCYALKRYFHKNNIEYKNSDTIFIKDVVIHRKRRYTLPKYMITGKIIEYTIDPQRMMYILRLN